MRPPLAVLLIVCLLVTSGCLSFLDESRPPSDHQAQDALDRSRTALADVTSYRALSNGSATMTAEDERDTVTLSGEVLVNVSARELNSTGRVSDTFLPGTGVRRTYVTGYTAYTECRLSGWGQQNLSASRPWVEYTPIGDQLALLNRTPVYWEGTERLADTETAVIVAHPSEQELEAVPGLWSLAPEESQNADFQNATLTLWIDTETSLPVLAHRKTVWRDAGATVTLSATWRFDDYNEPAGVTRPSFDESDVREHGC